MKDELTTLREERDLAIAQRDAAMSLLAAQTERNMRQELRQLLNRYCAENGSDTPDFILADYLMDALAAFDKAVRDRERWYGRMPSVAATEEPLE